MTDEVAEKRETSPVPLHIGITAQLEQGAVLIDFGGVAIAGLAMSPAQAAGFCERIAKAHDEVVRHQAAQGPRIIVPDCKSFVRARPLPAAVRGALNGAKLP